MKTYVEVGRKGLDDEIENTRLDITLSNSESEFYRSINYRKMIALKKGFTNYEFLDMEDPHDRFKDYVEESYIDNSEVFRDALPPGHEPENMGFYINFGKLKLKTLSTEHIPERQRKHSREKKRKKHKHHDKERKRSKSESKSHSLQESDPEPSNEDLPPRVPDSTPTEHFKAPISSPSHELFIKEKRKKLKLLLKGKKSRDTVEEVKSPKKRKKSTDPNVTLDKILMSRAKEVKTSEGKLNKSSSSYSLLPDSQNGFYPYYNIKQ